MGGELRFDGKVALVTGAGGGLGRSHALLLGSRGAKVVVNDLGGGMHGGGASQRPAELVVEEIKAAGGEAVADYHSVEEGEKIVQTALDTFGRIDIVINNAGILRDKSFAKMTDEDWDLIYRVHVLGSYKVTHAAWPHLREQNYGRVIMTSSAAGIYGNFGQANYSMAKLGLVGLAQTLGFEGENRNVHVNAIAPIAGSRLTKTVLPDALIDALKPEFVSPLVAYLCHEDCKENGALFEVGAGFIAKLRWERTKGVSIPLSRGIAIEDVAGQWKKITDWNGADHPHTTQESMAPLLANLNTTKSKGGNEHIDVDRVLGHEFKPGTKSYDERDVSLYALGVGAARDPMDASELKFVYELAGDSFAPLPTMAVVLPHGTMSGIMSIPGLTFNPMMLLHGEQYLELKRPLARKATITSKGRISQVYDKGKGAVLVVDTVCTDEQGREVALNQSSLFIRGIGGWGGDRGPSGAANEAPERKPDAVEEFKTDDSQALLYRLSGDYNPLHADPKMAAMGGFDKPILHGLCTFGVAGRAVLKRFCGNDPNKFKSIRVRFVKHVFPGETIITEMWKEGADKIVFRCKAKERDAIVLSNAAVELQSGFDLKDEEKNGAAASASGNGSGAKVKAVFDEMSKRVAAKPELVGKVGAVYCFDITGGGKWTVDLKSGGGSVRDGAPEKADCTIAMSDGDFLDLVTGKLDGQSAFMQGKLRVGGNMALASKLELIMK